MSLHPSLTYNTPRVGEAIRLRLSAARAELEPSVVSRVRGTHTHTPTFQIVVCFSPIVVLLPGLFADRQLRDASRKLLPLVESSGRSVWIVQKSDVMMMVRSFRPAARPRGGSGSSSSSLCCCCYYNYYDYCYNC